MIKVGYPNQAIINRQQTKAPSFKSKASLIHGIKGKANLAPFTVKKKLMSFMGLSAMISLACIGISSSLLVSILQRGNLKALTSVVMQQGGPQKLRNFINSNTEVAKNVLKQGYCKDAKCASDVALLTQRTAYKPEDFKLLQQATKGLKTCSEVKTGNRSIILPSLSAEEVKTCMVADPLVVDAQLMEKGALIK